MASGRVLAGFLVSSTRLTISSKPIKAKNAIRLVVKMAL